MDTRQYAILLVGVVALSLGTAAALPSGALDAQAQETATVSFADQSIDDETVTVDSVTLPDGGFVVIHDSVDGEADDVVGVSEYLEPGESTDVEVELAGDVEEDTELIAMAHEDSDGDEAFTFVESGGEEDGPYTADGEPVTDAATVSPEDDEADDDAEETEEADEDEGDEADEEADEETTEQEDDADDEADEEDDADDEADEEDDADDEADEEDDADEEATEQEDEADDEADDADDADENETGPPADAGPPFDEGPPFDGAPPEQANETGDQNATDEEVGEGLLVTDLDAPADATIGETLNVSATVENQGAEATTQRVEFRFDGRLVENRNVSVDAGAERTVTFEVQSGLYNLSEGEFRHGVFTADDWQLGTVTLEQSFALTDLEAPENATVGDEVTVDATVENPNAESATQSVEFRFAGAVADAETVSLDAGESETVSLAVNSSGVEPGNYTHGVFTVTDGALADIELTPAAASASVAFENQTAENDTVSIESVSVDEGGFVAVHDASLLDGNVVGSVVGVSEYLDPGDYEDVEVELFDVPGADLENETLEENQTLIAMPHLDTDGNESYDFVATNGSADGPYLNESDGAVVDAATVTVADEAAEPVTEAPENETAEPVNETETAEPVNETETAEPVNETETPEPVNETETAEPVNETETPEPVNETESPEPVNETETAEPVNETETPEPVNETETAEPVNETDTPDGAEPIPVAPDPDTPATDEPMTEDDEAVANESNENETATPADEESDAPTASVSFDDQESDGTTVTVESVNVSAGGFVVIHNDSLDEGDAIGSVVGVSEYLESGESEDVTVTLFDVPGVDYETDQLTENQTLVAMPHLDSDGDQTYDFVATNGSADGPYVEDGAPVTDDGNVSVASEA